MTNKFIYVFDVSTKNRLIDMQFELLKADEQSGVYVFANIQNQNFTLSESSYVLSDTLTF